MKVLFATLHAKFVHASLALPYLAATCSTIPHISTSIREYTINEHQDVVLQGLVAEKADVVLFSCYIWNIEQTLKLAADLRLILPETCIVLGGPEASYGAFELLNRNLAVDCIVRGEGEQTCRELLSTLARNDGTTNPFDQVAGITYRNGEDIVATTGREPIGSLDTIPSPFTAGLADLGKPLVYYETSRGCPFSCAFCMSSLEQGVRTFSMERIQDDLGLLMAKGVKTIKLVDRTFNYDAGRANAIWEFIIRNNGQSRFHFEIAADLLTDANLDLLRMVPEDIFRFEIGVQSKDAGTLEEVGRKSDLKRLFANVARLRRETNIILHLDLVAGLPKEDMTGFLDSLQSLFQLNPHHIQVEPLKVLKGSPMRKIAEQHGYKYTMSPPYKIRQTPWLTYHEICHIELISRLVDLFYNSGRFRTTMGILAEERNLSVTFNAFARFWQREQIPQQLTLTQLFETLCLFAAQELSEVRLKTVKEALCFDFCCAEYPAGKLPAFFPTREISSTRGKTGEIIRTMAIAEGSKVRTFSHDFSMDFRVQPHQQTPCTLTFVYISSPGKGLQVRITSCNNSP